MAKIKKTVKGFYIHSVIRDEEVVTKNNVLTDVLVTSKPRNDKKAKEIVIDTLGIEPDFINAIMITGYEEIEKHYEMELNKFIEYADEIEINE